MLPRGFSANFTRAVLIGIFIWISSELVLAEKEPVDEDLLFKSEKPPSVKGHTFDNTEVSTDEGTDNKSNLGFIHAFVAALSVIIVSELGDKTFFIAAIMAMRHPRLTVFLGAITALALMTMLSAFFGYAVTIIPRAYTYYISTFLFALFGLKMLKDGYYMSPTEGQEELEEVQQDLRKREDEQRVSTSKEEIPCCSALGCKNRAEQGLHFKYFPQNPTQRAIWVANVERENWEPTMHSFLCEIHFDNDQWEKPILCGKRKLKRGAVPTLFTNELADSDCESTKPETPVVKRRSKVESVEIVDPAECCKLPDTENANNTEISSDITEQQPQALPENLTTKNNMYEREAATSLLQDPESGVIRKANKPSFSVLGTISRVLLQSFTLTFVAEWGDRSQLTTILLAAREDIVGITIGGILGHAICTGLAVLGGRMIAQRISVRTVTLIGGVVFLLFAVTALFFDPNAE